VRELRESSRGAEERTGLGGAQLFVLQKLALAPALSVNELAERTLTHQSSVSVVVSRLVGRRLVSRRRAPDDGRRRELVLTASGRARLQRAPRLAQERLIESVEQLDQADQATLARLLDRLNEQMGVADRAGAMFFEEPAARPARRRRR
jgi:DNA-binding MarR family transcriptional regulator